MTKARDLSNIISGGFTADDIPNIDASKITTGTLADARISASSVSQHATSFDDNKIVNDISTLALRQASDANRSAYNTNSQFVDVFQDSTGITNLTNASRDTSGEYMTTISQDSNTNLLMTFESSLTGMEGTNADSYGASVAVSSPTLDSSTKKYGSNSMNIADPQHLILTPASGDLFGDAYSGDFTIEYWFQSTGGAGTYRAMFVKGNHSGNVQDIRAYFSSAESELYFDADFSGGQVNTSSAVSNVSSQFNHYAYVRQGDTLRVYFNGVQTDSTSCSGTLDDDYSTFQFGKSYVGGGTSYSFGYFDDIRFSNSARYPDGTSFTPPSSQLLYETPNATGSFENNAITALSSVSSMGAIITYQDFSGTNALNTDIVLELSADNGSNWSTATLSALPNFSTGIKMAKVNDLAVTAGTNLKYKISFANQASGTKEARIRGVALQY
jgi:hypothetical protein